MKRTFSTLSCMELDVSQVAALAARHGIDCVEIRLDKNHDICGMSIEQADIIRQTMAQYGVSILDLGLSASFTREDEAQLVLAKQGVDLAAAVQAKAVRIFAGGHQARFSKAPDEDFDGIMRVLRALCDYAAEKGVEVWAETHSSYSTGEAIRKLIDAVGHPNLYALWDVIHSIEFGEKPADSARILGDRLAHVHLKDGLKTADTDATQYFHTDLGLGELPLGAALQALEDIGYQGAVSLEWEAPWRPEIRELYPDHDLLLTAYNAWIDRFSESLLPPVWDAAWKTYTPPDRALACFVRGAYDDCLSIALESERFAVGKWIARVPVPANSDFTFSVLAKTDLSVHNVYALITLIDTNGDMQIREHPLHAKRCGPFWQFTDRYRTLENTAFIEVELWCKGISGQVSWFAPLLYPSAPMPERKVKVAVGYIDHRSKLQTLASNEQLILQTLDACGRQGADITVLGEGSRGRYTAASLAEKALPDDAPFCEAVRQKAREYGMYVVYNFHEQDNGDIYNTSMLIGRDGGTVGKYRKTHLTVGELEQGIVPGIGYPVFDTDFGKVGMLICYDQYFSETITPLVEAGAELICISTAGDAAEKGVARAMDGGVYLAVCGWNQENGHNWKPGRVIAPDGSFLAETDTDFEPAVCEIDLNQKIRRFWLSVGPANAEIRGVYRYEKNPDSFLG